MDQFDIKPETIKELTMPITDTSLDVLDQAVVSAKELYLNFLNDSTHRFKLLQYLEALSDNDPGLTYNICHNTENKLTGFCWMTSVMRSHLETTNSKYTSDQSTDHSIMRHSFNGNLLQTPTPPSTDSNCIETTEISDQTTDHLSTPHSFTSILQHTPSPTMTETSYLQISNNEELCHYDEGKD